MASNGNLEPGKTGDGMERLETYYGYFLGPDQKIEDILEVEAELLRSEGIDPVWPGLESNPQRASG